MFLLSLLVGQHVYTVRPREGQRLKLKQILNTQVNGFCYTRDLTNKGKSVSRLGDQTEMTCSLQCLILHSILELTIWFDGHKYLVWWVRRTRVNICISIVPIFDFSVSGAVILTSHWRFTVDQTFLTGAAVKHLMPHRKLKMNILVFWPCHQWEGFNIKWVFLFFFPPTWIFFLKRVYHNSVLLVFIILAMLLTLYHVVIFLIGLILRAKTVETLQIIMSEQDTILYFSGMSFLQWVLLSILIYANYLAKLKSV